MIRRQNARSGMILVAAVIAAVGPSVVLGQGVSPAPAPGLHLTLDEARALALSQSKGLALARLHIEELRHTRKAAAADYFPKVLSEVAYFHFNDNLGKVVAIPSGRFNLGGARTVNVLDQNTTFGSITVAQPVTPLLKVHQAVKLAKADEAIAAAQFDGGTRKLLEGVEQLYYGVYGTQLARGAALAGVGAAEQAWTSNRTPEARAAFLEAQQDLLAADKGLDDLAEQLNGLLGLPLDTVLVLAEPPMPVVSVPSAEQAVCMAIASSPEVREAAQTVEKARAGLAVAKLAFMPDINVFGSYFNQQGVPFIQNNIGAIGVQGSWTIFEFGKRSHTVRMREMQVAEASRQLQMARDKVSQATLKAYRELTQAQQALGIASELAQIRRKGASPATQALVVKAEGDLLQADIALRLALGQVQGMIGPIFSPTPGRVDAGAFRIGSGHDHGH
jgi:outer membrane protein TolC